MKNVNLSSLLDNYFRQESIEFFESCKKCKKSNVLHNKEIKIAKPPKILIIPLQRKNTILISKNECIVYFNEEIDLMDYIDLDLNSESNIIYGVINHKGSLEFHQYYSYIKFFHSNE